MSIILLRKGYLIVGDNMIDLKEEFGKYITEIAGKSKKTKVNYISMLSTLDKKIDGFDDFDFFENDICNYDSVIKKIRVSKEYTAINKKSNNTLSAAIALFENFLEYKKLDNDLYLSIKISNPLSLDVVKAIENKEKNIVINQINQLKNKLKIGQLVFMVPFGDKVRWKKGLSGVGKISKLPYDDEGKNFKINIDMFCSFETISRADLIPYPKTYDAADIGPSTKGSQNQALKQINLEQAVAVLRAIIELRPETKKEIDENVNSNIMKLVYAKQCILKKEYIPYQNKYYDLQGYNKIVYGIPGCGKSYYVENKILENVDEDNIIRTTFYLDYSNSDFIGQILPVVNESKITYEHIPGPFTRALEMAYKKTNEMIYLVIEEINRGNAAAIFGDTFQLLDRLKKDNKGRLKGASEYPISNQFIEKYFDKKGVEYEVGKIYIPANLTILATMNTSDQNVFPLDTAFKRRWKMQRIVNSWNDHKYKDYYIPFTDITWRLFVDKVNNKMLEASDDGLILEDKQLGAYFASEDMLVRESKEECPVNEKNKEKLESFTNKVIEYLYNDVFKFDRDQIFENKRSFNEIWDCINKYDNENFEGSGTLCLNIEFIDTKN